MKYFFFFLLPFYFLHAKEYPSSITIGFGKNDLFRKHHKTEEIFVEYHPSYHYYQIYPIAGMMMTFKRAFYAYGGFGVDVIVKKYFFFFPSIAAGYYAKGGGKGLGFPLEFRSYLSFGFKTDMSRFGVYFYHISNASLGHKNPGMESCGLFFSYFF